MASKTTVAGKTPHSDVQIGRDLAPVIEALENFIKKSTSSKKAATHCLKQAGILDEKGRLHRRYKP